MTIKLTETINKLVSDHVDSILNRISVKYNIKLEDLNVLINESVESKPVPVNQPSQVQQTATRTCLYVPTKGKRSGVTCGSKISTDREFCYRHTSKSSICSTNQPEMIFKEPIKTVPVEILHVKPAAPTLIESKKIPLLVFNKTLKVHTHPETGLVFSNDKKKVIGVLNSKKNIINHLSETEIELCKRLKFQYMDSSVESSNAFKLKSVEDMLCELSIDGKSSKHDNEYEEDTIDELEIIAESGEEEYEGDDYEE
jgi:hypothetical protein